MLSEGRAGIDNLYFLKDGKCHMRHKISIIREKMLNMFVLLCRPAPAGIAS